MADDLSGEMSSQPHNLGLVLIGRNEGERLRRCIESARGRAVACVYVDSGSTDGSVALARSLGVEVIELDTSIKFTAARARNAGFRRLLELAPTIPYVQFVDGDCEINADWWQKASDRLDQRPELAVVCGRRRERFPEASAYNRLVDLEWNTPVGDTAECGGDSMMRVEHFRAVGGFNEQLIAGEEPDLCFRLREKGWKIERLDAEMTLHDAAMTRFSQWWQREKRAGYAAAEGAAMHGRSPERYRVKMARSNWIWGLIIPLLAIVPAWPTRGISLAILLLYPLQYFRIRAHFARSDRRADAGLYAAATVFGKIPQMLGGMKYWTMRLTGRQAKLIEYKGAASATPSAQTT